MNYTDVAIEATEKAAQVILGHLGMTHQLDRKAQRDILTDVDLVAQKAIVDTIKAHFPEHDIMAEEGSQINGSPYVWIIDPLDGTINYVNRFPCFCTSIALQHSGETIFGIVNDPFNNRVFTSDGRRRVNQTGNLADAMIAVDWPASDEARERTTEVAKAIVGHARTLRSLGSSALALCYITEGWLDGFIHVDLEPWDAAAGALIVQKAGGVVTDFEGNPWTIASRQLVASNGLLHDELLAIIQ